MWRQRYELHELCDLDPAVFAPPMRAARIQQREQARHDLERELLVPDFE
jgi:hypothetical protein